MRAWWAASPYRGVGIYLGGARYDRVCAQPAYFNASWVSAVAHQGWSFALIYDGLQASCFTGGPSIDPTRAAAQGAANADDAMARARTLGFGVGNPIYADIESYDSSDRACARVVRTFLAAWTSELHARGYVSGVYASASGAITSIGQASGSPGYVLLDDLWIGWYNGRHDTFAGGYLPPGAWANHQRLHQYAGSHDESYAGVDLTIDSDYMDGALARPGVSFVSGSFVQTPDGSIYRLAGGAPLPITDCAAIGGCGTPIAVPSLGQFSTSVADGTLLRGEPSSQTWIIVNGARARAGPSAAAILVDDGSLSGLPVTSSPLGSYESAFAQGSTEWTAYAGHWRTVAGRFRVKPLGTVGAYSTLSTVLFGDGTYVFRGRMPQATRRRDWIGLSFGKDVPSDTYRQSGYTVMLRASGRVSLWKGRLGLVAPFRPTGTSPAQHFVTIRIVRADTTIDVYVGKTSAPQIEFQDIAAGAYGTGYISLVDTGDAASFASVRVSN